jgi:predicted alternative tryptophan synthase beta-subunit
MVISTIFVYEKVRNGCIRRGKAGNQRQHCTHAQTIYQVPHTETDVGQNKIKKDPKHPKGGGVHISSAAKEVEG